ncbi:hypothetical protein KR018_007571, partial [Drosophila ironensis]
SVCAIVEYEYTAKEPDELDLRKGAIIHRIKQMPGGWWQGTLKATGTTGMFPDNFVRVLDASISSNGNGSGSGNGNGSGGDHSDEGTGVQLRDKSATSNRRCKVIYSYTQVNDDELTLAVGDVIEFLGEVEEGWWRGRLRSKVGVFPSNFVQHIEPSPILASKRPPTIGATVTTSALTTKAANVAAASSTTTTTTGSTSVGLSGTAAAAVSVPAPAPAPATTTSTSKQFTKSRAAPAPAEPAAISGGSVSVSGSGSGPGAPMLPPKPQREYCRVEFPYAPQNDDELELKVDDVIALITTELPDKGWWKGELRGKVGVFPDNFVKMLAPSEGDAAAPPPPRPRARARTGVASGMGSVGAGAGAGAADEGGVRIPLRNRAQRGGSFEFLGARMASFITTIFAPINEPATSQPLAVPQSQRKIGNASSTTTSHHMTTTNSSNSSTTTVTTQQKEQIGGGGGGSASTTSKVYIKKTGSSSNSTASSSATTASSSSATGSSAAGRKESFGSRDSLNDILSETGLPTGNVAAQRKSLENKNLDLSKPPGAAAISQQRSSTNSTSVTSTVGTALAATAISKSLENMDEKVKSPPPPVLSKKPNVPLKKTPTGGVPVAGNLLGGKKKNPEGKLTSAVSHDLADGLAGSKLLTGANQLPDSGAAGNLVMRRAATIAVEDTDFDRVERASILTDMRQGRVKAPKRRPPSAAINVLGESNNNSVYVNGSGTGGGTGGSASELSEDGGKPTAASSDDNSTGEEPQLAKPKPREWEKKKAPWMEELKASQVTRKKTSPSVEPRGATVAERTSKLFASEQAIISSSSSSSSTTTKVQSSAVTSSMFVENSSSSSSSVTTSSHNANTATATATAVANDAIMSRSLSAAKAAASSDEETKATRPNSLSIRNQRSVSPLVKSSTASSSQSQEEKPNQLVNNHSQEPVLSTGRVNLLEQRIEKLEGVVQNQQRTIEELVNALKSEAERVKVLRSELDKYAQCVTQV